MNSPTPWKVAEIKIGKKTRLVILDAEGNEVMVVNTSDEAPGEARANAELTVAAVNARRP